MTTPEPIPTPEAPIDEATRLLQDAQRLVGQTLSDRYRIDSVLGVGGMGAVYQAEHTHLRKRVAVKVLHPEMTQLSEAVQRFEREAVAAANIEHPNVVAAKDFGKLSDGSFFLVLDFVEGRNLRELLDRGDAFPVERVVHIVRQILHGLVRAHGLSIVHRDLKPENVMLVQRDDDPDFVKMLDFGIAKVPVGDLAGPSEGKVSPTSAALTKLGMVYGTPEYMAPEQALGQEVDHRADLYALGVMLFEMLAGRRPFVASNPVQILGMVVSKPVPPFAEVCPDRDIPPAIEEIVRTLLAKIPDDRYADARAALAALDAIFPPASSPSLGQTGARPVASSDPSAQRLSQATTLPVQGDSPLARLPPLLQDRRVQLGAGGAGLLLLLLVVALAFRGDPAASKGAVASASASTSAAAEPPPSPLSVAEIDEAKKQGAKALLALKDKAPQDARLLRAIASAQVDQKNTEDALSAFGELFAADPEASADPEVQEDLLKLTLGEKKPDPIFTFLEEKTGSGGPDVLYALLVSPKSSAFLKKKAGESLQKSRDRASPSLKVVLDLRNTASVGPKGICAQAAKLRQIFIEAKEHGDSRALMFLTPMTGANKDCGSWYKKTNCYACIQGDGKLNEAISAIREREKQKKK
jgi:serine/threonine-protein kinase